MISKFAKTYCKDDIALIENYDKAISDSEQTWHCHHRKEIITSKKELIENNEYFNRPANELIFLTHSEHNSLHKKGKHRSYETKKKLVIANKGKKMSEEAKQKLSDAFKALLWYNNGIISVRAKSCPEGFVKGRLKKLVHYKNGQVIV